jgi:nitrite transporter NirC
MYLEAVSNAAMLARAKADFLKRAPLSYLTASFLAGAYVGMGIVLIFCIGAPLALADSIYLKTLMGVSFGIALTLVVFAGSELFTGNNMYMVIGLVKRTTSWKDLARVWSFSWAGNLVGSLVLAWMVVHAGAVAHAAGFLEKISVLKMTMPAEELFLRAVLCNWLVCLALWTAGRTKSDSAKCVLIFWCLFAFIACGYEHSVANMTLLALSLFSPHGDAVSWLGFMRNLGYVTAGNIVGGAVFVGMFYCMATYRE